MVVSPIPFQAAFDCALSSTVADTAHPVGQGLLPGSRPFHQIPTEPPVHHHHRTVGLCRFCSGARTLARRAPTRPRASQSGDFPQQPVVADSVHRQLPSTSQRCRDGGTPPKDLLRGKPRQKSPRRVPSAMPAETPGSATSPGPATPAKGPRLVPCLMLRGGRVCVPGPEGPVEARTADGKAIDPFDVLDLLSADYPRLYVVDLDGIERQEAQLDYLQEFSREVTLWVDAGVRNADQAIDVIVAGSRRAVLSTAYLRGPKELRRAWRLSTAFVFEAEVEGALVTAADSTWETRDPYELLRGVRELGIDRLLVSPRNSRIDWELVRRVATLGSTYVDGSFELADAPRLAAVGAAGGIFHLDRLIAERLSAAGSPEPGSDALRDDENQNQLTHDE
jgi:hypothetical protein